VKKITQAEGAELLAEHGTWDYGIEDSIPYCTRPGCEHRYTKGRRERPPFPEDVALHQLRMLSAGGIVLARKDVPATKAT
jgi:hypothetical protein